MTSLLEFFFVCICVLFISCGLILLEQQRVRDLRDLLLRRVANIGKAPTIVLYDAQEIVAPKHATDASLTGVNSLLQHIQSFVRYDPLLPMKILVSWRIATVVLGVVAGILTFVAQVLLESYLLYLCQPLLWMVLLRLYVKWCEGHQSRLLFDQFPDALDVLVRSMRVGVPLTQAVDYVATNIPEPTALRFRHIAGRLGIGATIGEALEDLVKKSPLPEYRFFAAALSLQAQTGGNVVGTLENLSRTIRTRAASRVKMKSLLAEPKMSMTILALLPFIMLTLLALINFGYIKPLFVTRSGHHVVLSALGLWGTGLFTARSLIKRGMP